MGTKSNVEYFARQRAVKKGRLPRGRTEIQQNFKIYAKVHRADGTVENLGKIVDTQDQRKKPLTSKLRSLWQR